MCSEQFSEHKLTEGSDTNDSITIDPFQREIIMNHHDELLRETDLNMESLKCITCMRSIATKLKKNISI
jgi:hypothetical protein